MTPDERGEVYEALESVIAEHGLDGLEVIVDALVTIASAEAEDEDPDWIDAADGLLVLYNGLQGE